MTFCYYDYDYYFCLVLTNSFFPLFLAVHHEEFILSGVLRQELDFDAYQIQYVSTLQTGLRAAVAAAEAALANSGSHPITTVLPAPTSLRFINTQSNTTSPVSVVASRRQNHPKLDPTIHNIKSPSSSSSITNTGTQSAIVCHATTCTPTPRSDCAYPMHRSLSVVSENSSCMNSSLTARTANVVCSTMTAATTTPTTRVHTYPSENYGPAQRDAVSVGFRSQATFPSHIPEPLSHHARSQPSPTPSSNLQHTHPVPSTGLQHLLVGSSTSPSVPSYMSSNYSFPRIDSRVQHGDAVCESLPQEFPAASSSILVTYTTSAGLTNLNSTARVSTAGSVMAVHGPSETAVFVPSSSQSIPDTVLPRISSDSGHVPIPDVSLDLHKAIPKPRPSTLFLSGTGNTFGPQLPTAVAPESTIPVTTQPTQSIQRPVTALTAMIVAAEASGNELVPSLPLGDSDVVVMGPVSSFVLPKPSGYHRSHNTPSANVPPTVSVTSGGGALNARSAAADAHAVATATAAAANALHSAEAKGMVVGLKAAPGPLSVPVSNLRNPCVYTPDALVAETKKRIASGGSTVSVSSTSSAVLTNVNPLGDAVKSLLNSQLSFQPLSAVEIKHHNTTEASPLNSSDLGPSRPLSTSDIPTCFSFEDSVASSSVTQFSTLHSSHSATPTTTAVFCVPSEVPITSDRFDPVSTTSGSRPPGPLEPGVESSEPPCPAVSEVGESYAATSTEPEVAVTHSSANQPFTEPFWTNTSDPVPDSSVTEVASAANPNMSCSVTVPVTSDCSPTLMDNTDTTSITQSSNQHSTDQVGAHPNVRVTLNTYVPVLGIL